MTVKGNGHPYAGDARVAAIVDARHERIWHSIILYYIYQYCNNYTAVLYSHIAIYQYCNNYTAVLYIHIAIYQYCI